MITYLMIIAILNLSVSAIVNAFKARIVEYEECNIKEEDEFDRKIVLKNMQRLKIMDVKNKLEKVWIEFTSILKWESKFKSTLFLFLYILVIYCFQPWMMTFAILLPLLRNSSTFFMEKLWWCNKKHSFLSEPNGECVDSLLKEGDIGNDKDGSNDERKITTPSIKEAINRIHSAYDSRVKVQQILIKVARFGERIQNIIHFKVPFLSIIALLMVTTLTIFFYFIPIRYIVMMVGVDHILKGLLRPNSEGCLNRVLNFISKAPDNEELKDWAMATQMRSKCYVQRKAKLFKNNVLSNRASITGEYNLSGSIENVYGGKECSNYDLESSTNLALKTELLQGDITQSKTNNEPTLSDSSLCKSDLEIHPCQDDSGFDEINNDKYRNRKMAQLNKTIPLSNQVLINEEISRREKDSLLSEKAKDTKRNGRKRDIVLRKLKKPNQLRKRRYTCNEDVEGRYKEELFPRKEQNQFLNSPSSMSDEEMENDTCHNEDLIDKFAN